MKSGSHHRLAPQFLLIYFLSKVVWEGFQRNKLKYMALWRPLGLHTSHSYFLGLLSVDWRPWEGYHGQHVSVLYEKDSRGSVVASGRLLDRLYSSYLAFGDPSDSLNLHFLWWSVLVTENENSEVNFLENIFWVSIGPRGYKNLILKAVESISASVLVKTHVCIPYRADS